MRKNTDDNTSGQMTDAEWVLWAVLDGVKALWPIILLIVIVFVVAFI